MCDITFYSSVVYKNYVENCYENGDPTSTYLNGLCAADCGYIDLCTPLVSVLE